MTNRRNSPGLAPAAHRPCRSWAAGTDGTLTLCVSSPVAALFTQLVGAQAGGTWTAPGGAPHSGTIDPAVDPAGAYTYTLVASAPCVSDAGQVTVTIVSPPDAGVDGTLTVCDQGAPTGLFPSLAGADAGGTWSAPGGAAFSGTYDPSVGSGGVYTYTVNGIAPCGADQATVTVGETSSPDAGLDGGATLCASVTG